MNKPTFTKAEQLIITSVVDMEKENRRELPKTSIYKAIALDAAKRMGFTWQEVTALWNG